MGDQLRRAPPRRREAGIAERRRDRAPGWRFKSLERQPARLLRTAWRALWCQAPDHHRGQLLQTTACIDHCPSLASSRSIESASAYLPRARASRAPPTHIRARWPRFREGCAVANANKYRGRAGRSRPDDGLQRRDGLGILVPCDQHAGEVESCAGISGLEFDGVPVLLSASSTRPRISAIWPRFDHALAYCGFNATARRKGRPPLPFCLALPGTAVVEMRLCRDGHTRRYERIVMRRGLRPVLLPSGQCDQVHARSDRRRVDSDGRLIRLDGSRQIALPFALQPHAPRSRRRHRAAPSPGRGADRPRRASARRTPVPGAAAQGFLARTRRSRRVIPRVYQAAPIPGTAHSRLELARRGGGVPPCRQGASDAVVRVRRAWTVRQPHILRERRIDLVGRKERIGQRETGRHGRRVQRHGLLQQSAPRRYGAPGGTAPRLPGRTNRTGAPQPRPARTPSQAVIVLLPGVQQHPQAAEPLWIPMDRPAPHRGRCLWPSAARLAAIQRLLGAGCCALTPAATAMKAATRKMWRPHRLRIDQNQPKAPSLASLARRGYPQPQDPESRLGSAPPDPRVFASSTLLSARGSHRRPSTGTW